jgi:large subunit ribosomal protein L10
MPTEAKQAMVADLISALSGNGAAIVSDYRGLTVSDIGKVRRELRGKGITYRVVKNRLARIAAAQAGREELAPLLMGPTAIALGGTDEAALARGVLEAVRPYRTVVVRGGAIGGATLDANAVTRLATLPTREVLLAQLAGGIASPIGTMAGLLTAPLRNLGFALAQLRDQREQASA